MKVVVETMEEARVFFEAMTNFEIIIKLTNLSDKDKELCTRVFKKLSDSVEMEEKK